MSGSRACPSRRCRRSRARTRSSSPVSAAPASSPSARLLGMAAHLEGKGVSVLDMTGVAQKGGAVTTFVRIAARPEDLHTIRIAAGEANAVIGSDLLVTAENSIMTRMQTRRDARGDQHQPDGDRRVHQESGPADAVGRDGGRRARRHRRRRDALPRRHAAGHGVARRLARDQHLPARLRVADGHRSRCRARRSSQGDRAQRRRGGRQPACLRLGTARVPRSRRGRAAVAPGRDATSAAIASSRPTSTLRSRAASSSSPPTRMPRSRSATRRWSTASAAIETRVVGGSDALTDAVARNYFKLLAIKDEYEVARLYTDGEFERQVAAAFEGDYTLRYHFAPPLWVTARQGHGRAGQAHLRRVDAPAARRSCSAARRLRGTLARSVRTHGGAAAGTPAHRRVRGG